jgi:hypothetical protein
MTVHFCPHCGRLNLADFLYCPYCGMPVAPGPGLEEAVDRPFRSIEERAARRTGSRAGASSGVSSGASSATAAASVSGGARRAPGSVDGCLADLGASLDDLERDMDEFLATRHQSPGGGQAAAQ